MRKFESDQTTTNSTQLEIEERYLLDPNAIKEMPYSLSSKFGKFHRDAPRIIRALAYFYKHTTLANKPFIEKSIPELAKDKGYPSDTDNIVRADIKILKDLGLLSIDSGRRKGRASRMWVNNSAIIREVCSVA